MYANNSTDSTRTQVVDSEDFPPENLISQGRLTEARAVRSRRSIQRNLHQSPSSRCLQGAPSVTHLPEYSPELRVNSSMARHDKMEVRATYSVPAFSDEDELFAFRRYLGAPPKGERESEEHDVYSRFCCRAPRNGEMAKLKVRTRDIELNDQTVHAPLFGGELATWEKREGGLVFCSPVCDLRLNPTRAINLNEAGLRSSDRVTALTSRSESDQLLGLDGVDNVLLQEIDQERYESGERDFFDAVTEGLREEFSRSFRLAQGGLDVCEEGWSPVANAGGSASLRELSLQLVETYWEMTVADAPAFLERITPALESYHRNVQARLHGKLKHGERDHAIDRRHEENQRSVRMFFSKGEELQVYAKLGNRIRFEVKHRPGDNARLLDAGMTAANVDGFLGKLDELEVRAANRVNDLLAFLETWREQSPRNFASRTEYIVQWTRILGTDKPALDLLERLRHNGRIVGAKGLPDDEQRTLGQAKKFGFVVSDRRGLYHPNSELVRLTPPEAVPRLSHKAVTQPDESDSVTRSSSTVENRVGRVLPSPPFFLNPGIW